MATQDLCTRAEVRTFLQIAAANTGQNDVIDTLITAASDSIMRQFQREFKTTTAGSTARSFEYAGGGFLSLAPFDLRSVAQIRLDTDEASPTTLASTEYRLYPQNAPHGVYTAIKLAPSLVHSRARWEQRIVEVTSTTWGFATVPTDVKQAAILTVAIWLRRDVTAYEQHLGPDGEEVAAPRSLPMAAVDLLRPFERQAYT